MPARCGSGMVLRRCSAKIAVTAASFGLLDVFQDQSAAAFARWGSDQTALVMEVGVAGHIWMFTIAAVEAGAATGRIDLRLHHDGKGWPGSGNLTNVCAAQTTRRRRFAVA